MLKNKITILFSVLVFLFSVSSVFADGDTEDTKTQKDASKKAYFYKDAGNGNYFKPVVDIIAGIQHLMLDNPSIVTGKSTNEDRTVTLAMGRFGFQGREFGYLNYKFTMERNLGKTGSSIWDGNIMMSIRELYLQYDKNNIEITGGVFVDDASLDYFSEHMANFLLTDQYTRDPLVFSGLNRAQGIGIKYNVLDMAKIGVTFSSGNPLNTSASYAMRGNVTTYSSLYNAVIRGLDNANDITTYTNLTMVTPSIIVKSPKIANSFMEVKFAYQIYQINSDLLKKEDANLDGTNMRISVCLNLLDGMIKPFFNYNFRKHEQILGSDINLKDDTKYRSNVTSMGLDFNMKGVGGIGANYAIVFQDTGPHQRDDYLNIGATYWIEKDQLSVNARFTSLVTKSEGKKDDGNSDDTNIYAAVRLKI